MLTEKVYILNPQVAIAGRVLDGETEQPISGAIVQIDKEIPPKFKTILSMKKLQYGAQWEKMSDRIDRKITASDGYFYFVDLPQGEYTLKASLPSVGTSYKQIHVSKAKEYTLLSRDKDLKREIIPTSKLKIELKLTGIKGKITDESEKALFNAKVKVQIEESPGESTLSDRKGNYSLLGLDASPSGQRTVNLIVSAKGYQEKVSQPIEIKQGEVIGNQNFSLEKKQINNN